MAKRARVCYFCSALIEAVFAAEEALKKEQADAPIEVISLPFEEISLPPKMISLSAGAISLPC
jgi:hypothetical protein